MREPAWWQRSFDRIWHTGVHGQWGPEGWAWHYTTVWELSFLLVICSLIAYTWTPGFTESEVWSIVSTKSNKLTWKIRWSLGETSWIILWNGFKRPVIFLLYFPVLEICIYFQYINIFLSPQSKLCLEVMEKFLLLPYPQDQPSLNWQVTPTCL